MDTERRRSRDYHWLLGDKSDPNKITIKIERQIWKHVRHDDEGRRSWHVEGVTVRSGRCRLAGCNAAARSGMVEYDHLLPPQPAEVLGHDSRDHVWATRSRALCNQLHRPCGIVLRFRRKAANSTNDQKPPNAQARPERFHRSLPMVRAITASLIAAHAPRAATQPRHRAP